jgi:hypothetical protein
MRIRRGECSLVGQHWAPLCPKSHQQTACIAVHGSNDGTCARLGRHTSSERKQKSVMDQYNRFTKAYYTRRIKAAS